MTSNAHQDPQSLCILALVMHVNPYSVNDAAYFYAHFLDFGYSNKSEILEETVG